MDGIREAEIGGGGGVIVLLDTAQDLKKCAAELGRECGVPLSDVEWAALRHMEALAARVAKNPGLRRLGYRVELSPYLRALLEGGR